MAWGGYSPSSGKTGHCRHRQKGEAQCSNGSKKTHALAEADDADTLAKGCALIRSNLHVDIDQVHTEEEWAELYAQALWLERWRIKNLAELIAALFGESKR